MKNAIAIIFISLIGLMLLGGCTSPKTKVITLDNPQQNTDTEPQQNSAAEPQQNQQQTGLKLDASKYGEFIDLYCKDYFTLKGKYLEKEAENQCYSDIAVAAEDETLCELMIDSEMNTQQKAINTCYYFVAEKKKNEEICNLIQNDDSSAQLEEREQCYASIYGPLLRPDLCEKLTLDEVKKRCLSDVEYCTENDC